MAENENADEMQQQVTVVQRVLDCLHRGGFDADAEIGEALQKMADAGDAEAKQLLQTIGH